MLLDSNIIIYAARSEHQFLRDFMIDHKPRASWISYAEVLGFAGLDPIDAQFFSAFFSASRMFEVSQAVLMQAASLRQQRRMSLGDAVIGATAMIEGLTLVTRNTSDFHWISGLRLLDPFQA